MCVCVCVCVHWFVKNCVCVCVHVCMHTHTDTHTYTHTNFLQILDWSKDHFLRKVYIKTKTNQTTTPEQVFELTPLRLCCIEEINQEKHHKIQQNQSHEPSFVSCCFHGYYLQHTHTLEMWGGWHQSIQLTQNICRYKVPFHHSTVNLAFKAKLLQGAGLGGGGVGRRERARERERESEREIRLKTDLRTSHC